MAQIFISYSRSDRPFIDQFLPLIRRVYGSGSLWFDDEIHGGVDWWQMILTEVGNCQLFVYLISNESLESPYCQAELHEALRLHKQLLPVIVRRLKPPYPGNIEADLANILRKTQYVDLSAGFHDPNTISALYAATNRLLVAAQQQTATPITITPTPEPAVPDKKKPESTIPFVYIGTVVVVVLFVLGLGLFLARQIDGNAATTPTAFATTDVAQVSTLSSFQAQQTTEAEGRLATETQSVLNSEVTFLSMTETIARVTLIAQSTMTPQQTDAQIFPVASLSTTEYVMALTPQTSNEGWRPYITGHDFDGVTMMLVPAGSFEMGSKKDEIDSAVEMCRKAADNGAECLRSWYEDEAQNGDNTQTFIAPFWIDKTEISRDQYQQCVGCPVLLSSSASTGLNQPINRVAWESAKEYCEWREARLPTEAEWEYAARGPDRWIFPWGDDFDGTHANHCDSNCGGDNPPHAYVNEENDDGNQWTAPVESYPGGASWIGALNMSGNVWEWTSSLHVNYPYRQDEQHEGDTGLHVLRGGSYLNPENVLRAATRTTVNNDEEAFEFGIRCVDDYD